MNPFEMVVLIVAITAVASVLRARYGIRRDRHGNEFAIQGADDRAQSQALREEIRALKERIQVLERLATDDTSGIRLDREIEKLRDRT